MAKIGSRNINPMIFEKTRDGEYLYDVYSRLIRGKGYNKPKPLQPLQEFLFSLF